MYTQRPQKPSKRGPLPRRPRAPRKSAFSRSEERAARVARAISAKQAQGIAVTPAFGAIAPHVDAILSGRPVLPPRPKVVVPPRYPKAAPRAPRPRKPRNLRSDAHINSPMSPTTEPIPWDITGAINMIEHLLAHYSLQTDLLSDVTPRQFLYYCIYLCIQHLNNVGSVTGLVGFPVTQPALAVPYALAKYLEYMGRYHFGDAFLNLSWSYDPTSFTGDTLLGSCVGQGCLDYPRYATGVASPLYPDWLFGIMDNIPELEGTGLPDAPGQIAFLVAGSPSNPLFTWDDFLAAPSLVQTVSSEITKRGNTINLSRIPTRAPDCSAYARCISPPQIGSPQTYVVGPDLNYDPELVPMFNPLLLAGTLYDASSSKSVVSPTIVWPLPISGYHQITSMWVFLASSLPTGYAPGRAKRSLTFEGVPLKTFYPREQPVDGDSLTNHIQSEVNVIRQGKATASTDSVPVQQNTAVLDVAIFAMVAFTVMQRRMNAVEVCHYNSPPIVRNTDGTTGTPVNLPILFPQFMYADNSWSNVEMPISTAVSISTIGPIIHEGALTIPVSMYGSNITGQGIGNSFIGPENWSAFGFNNGETQYFPNSILQNTAWGPRVATIPVRPNLPIDSSTLSPTLCNEEFMATYYAAVPTYDLKSEAAPTTFANYVCPAFPSSATSVTVQQSFQTYLKENTASQAINTSPVNRCLHGDKPVMLCKHTINESDTIVTPISVVGSNSDSGYMQKVGFAIDEVTSPIDLTVTDISHAAMHAQGNTMSISTNVTEVKKRKLLLKALKLYGLAASNLPDPGLDSTIAKYGVDMPWGSSVGGIITNVAQQLTQTTSPFKDIISKAKATGQDYDIVKLAKEYSAASLNRSMVGVTTTSVPLAKVNKERKKSNGKMTARHYKHLASQVVDVGSKAIPIGVSLGKSLLSVL